MAYGFGRFGSEERSLALVYISMLTDGDRMGCALWVNDRADQGYSDCFEGDRVCG